MGAMKRVCVNVVMGGTMKDVPEFVRFAGVLFVRRIKTVIV
jgi:hypothetical protein